MTPHSGNHESFSSAEEPAIPSERSFGFVFTVVFAIVGVYLAIYDYLAGAVTLAVLSVAALCASVLRPTLLSVPNRLWARFGLLLHKIISPVVMAGLLFLVFTPVGLIMRLLGKDPLRRRLEKGTASYWIDRADIDQTQTSMRNQF